MKPKQPVKNINKRYWPYKLKHTLIFSKEQIKLCNCNRQIHKRNMEGKLTNLTQRPHPKSKENEKAFCHQQEHLFNIFIKKKKKRVQNGSGTTEDKDTRIPLEDLQPQVLYPEQKNQ